MDKKLARDIKLAEKNVLNAAVLSFLFPILGYRYTGRRWAFYFHAFHVGFLIVAVAIIIFHIPGSFEPESNIPLIAFCSVSFYAGIIAANDNVQAIKKARRSVRQSIQESTQLKPQLRRLTPPDPIAEELYQLKKQMNLASAEWYLRKNSKRTGPFTLEQLRSQGLDGRSLVCKFPDTAWRRAKDYPELVSYLGL